MHDPMTQAFVIKFPWKQRGSDYRPALITIWHVDPETDGSDDSCGFGRIRLTDAEKTWCQRHAEQEYLQFFNPEWRGINLCESGPMEIVLAAYLECRFFLGTPYWKPLKAGELDACMRLVYNPMDNIRSVAIGAITDHQEFERLLVILLRNIKRSRRRWYQHPKWHFRHWQVNIEPLMTFKRWAFTRCSKCGRRFRWGESPVANSWGSTGPMWFRSEQVHHMDCNIGDKVLTDSGSVNQNPGGRPHV